MHAKTYVAAILWLAMLLMLAILPATAQFPEPLTGAIWTTTGGGEKVDANLYDQKCPPAPPNQCVTPPLVPFLNGGPSFTSPRKWVPDDMYYFQVTDPSGKTLLSNDNIESRRFRVYTDSDGLKHVEYPVPGYPSPDSFHLTCNDVESDNITIALCPFDDTPNNGGEYKLWITPVGAYEQYGGFVGRYSKTDNFKVKKLASVWGRKVDDAGDPLEGVCIILYKVTKVHGQDTLTEIARTCTNEAGEFSFSNLSEGKYAVDEDLACTDCGGIFDECTRVSPPGPIYFTITKGNCGTRGKNPTPGTPIYIGEFVNDCGPPPEATLAGRKFLDVDGDACWDEGTEPTLAGWTLCLEMKDGNGSWVPAVNLYGVAVPCQTTAADGFYEFPDLGVPMTYRICETGPAGWLQTGPNTDPDEVCLVGPPGADDPCDSVVVSPADADVTVCAVNGCYIVNFGETADIETQLVGLNFGNKLAELCVEKRDACTNALLPGFEFTLYDCACETPVVEDGREHAINPIVTDGDNDCWVDLLAGDYCVKETASPGWISVGPAQQCITLEAGGTATVTFYNWAPCMGLTPGYWKNWRNHYTSEQFCELITGTIADVGDCTADIAAADAIFEHWDASPGDELTILKAFLLADQLTLNLTQLSGMPNPSDGSLVPECSLDYNGTPIVLSEVIAQALDILSDGYGRDDILTVKNWLAAFAEARLSTCPCIP